MSVASAIKGFSKGFSSGYNKGKVVRLSASPNAIGKAKPKWNWVQWTVLAGVVGLVVLASMFDDRTPRPTPPPSAPLALPKYQPIQIESSSIEHNNWGPDYCVATFKWGRVRYVVESKRNELWNRCDVLTPGKMYFANWESDERKEISIGVPKQNSLATNGEAFERDLEDVTTYSVRRWTEF